MFRGRHSVYSIGYNELKCTTDVKRVRSELLLLLECRTFLARAIPQNWKTFRLRVVPSLNVGDGKTLFGMTLSWSFGADKRCPLDRQLWGLSETLNTLRRSAVFTQAAQA